MSEPVPQSVKWGEDHLPVLPLACGPGKVFVLELPESRRQPSDAEAGRLVNHFHVMTGGSKLRGGEAAPPAREPCARCGADMADSGLDSFITPAGEVCATCAAGPKAIRCEAEMVTHEWGAGAPLWFPWRLEEGPDGAHTVPLPPADGEGKPETWRDRPPQL